MKLKIYKHLSLKTNIDDDISKIIPYFASDFVRQYIKEEITIDVEKTNLDYQDEKLYTPNVGIYDVVMLVYEQGTFPIYGRTSPYSPSLIRCLCSVNNIEDKIDYSWKVFVHEILHALCFKLMKEKGVYIPNMLDYSLPTPYYKNDDPYAKDGNFSQQLNVLKDFYMPVVTLTRISDNGVETRGELVYGNFKCKTLERPWKGNKTNISCIPKGEYICHYSFSFKKMKYTYLLQGTSPRSGIRIHSGNYWFDVEGCILLGDSFGDINNDGEIDIKNSRAVINAFEKIMNKKPFTLIIK